MILSDCHMHTWFSKDSQADPEAMVKEAVNRGLKAVCFTDHEDKDYVFDGVEYIFDADEYFQTMRGLQEKYKNQIEIRIGVEIGFQPHLGGFYKEFTKSNPFDYVIGSVHNVGGKDPYLDDFFTGRTDAECYRQTFEETLADLKSIRDFDALGHLDYVVRYGKNREKDYHIEAYKDIVEAILRHLIEHGKGLELNMAGLKYGLPFAHPVPEVLKWYRELGGEIVTVGADAHKPEHIAYEYAKASEILKTCGFDYYTEFIGRNPVFRRI